MRFGSRQRCSSRRTRSARGGSSIAKAVASLLIEKLTAVVANPRDDGGVREERKQHAARAARDIQCRLGFCLDAKVASTGGSICRGSLESSIVRAPPWAPMSLGEISPRDRRASPRIHPMASVWSTHITSCKGYFIRAIRRRGGACESYQIRDF